MLYIEDAISEMAINSNAILLLKFKMSARNMWNNIFPCLAVYLFAEAKAPTEIKGRLSTDFIQSHPILCICVKQSFPSYAGEKFEDG